MDGEVLPENLRSVGKDEVWLTRKLREQGYHLESLAILESMDPNTGEVIFRENA